MRLNFPSEASRLLLAAVLLGAGPAAAQDYPSGAEAAAVSAWLEKSTNIAPASVVSVTPELVVAIVGKTTPPTPGGPLRLTLREEVIAPAYVDTVGGRSSLMSMEIHCEERRVRMDERRLYSGLNLTGAVEISDPSAEWVRIPEGSIMDEVARAACDAEFSWPLRFAGAGPAAGVAVAALNTPPPLPLPPGPDATPVEDEPAPVEEKIPVSEPPPVAEPEVVAPAETVVEAEDLEVAAAEPVAAPEIAVAPEPPAPPVAEPAAAENSSPTQTEPQAPIEVAAEPVPPPELSAPLPPGASISLAAGVEPAPAEIVAPADPPPTGPVFAIQIGAYETPEMAEAAWATLSANRPILVEGLSFEIRPVRVKGKDWLRGLVGRFASRKEATAFCTALAGSDYGCILRTLAD